MEYVASAVSVTITIIAFLAMMVAPHLLLEDVEEERRRRIHNASKRPGASPPL